MIGQPPSATRLNPLPDSPCRGALRLSHGQKVPVRTVIFGLTAASQSGPAEPVVPVSGAREVEEYDGPLGLRIPLQDGCPQLACRHRRRYAFATSQKPSDGASDWVSRTLIPNRQNGPQRKSRDTAPSGAAPTRLHLGFADALAQNPAESRDLSRLIALRARSLRERSLDGGAGRIRSRSLVVRIPPRIQPSNVAPEIISGWGTI